MKTNDEIVAEYKHLMASEVMNVWDEKTSEEVFMPDWLRTTLENKDKECEERVREERERIALTMSKMFGRELDWKMNPEQMQEALLSFIRPLTPTKTDKQA